MGQILISAANKSSGKTIVTTGICSALRKQNRVIQPFKKGPDYIDPMWLSTAAQRDCYNLDFWTQSRQEILDLYHTKSRSAELSIVEANKGLYDGMDLDGSNSNAALAKLLELPVVLVLDCRGTIRGIAPLLLGYQEFDHEVNIKGVILNFVGGSRHEQKLHRVVEHYTDLEVVGAIQRDERLMLEERYLGLMPSNEDQDAIKKIDSIGNAIREQVDLDRLESLAEPQHDMQTTPVSSSEHYPYRIGIAQDRAFGFYYPDDLEKFKTLGATLVPFNTIEDQNLPDVDALFLGGGFPEKCLTELANNTTMRNQILNTLSAGLPAYAECGGLMYLCRSIEFGSQRSEMVGLIDADCIMTPSPQGRGYIQFKENQNSIWPDQPQHSINAHEFHYSYLDHLPGNTPLCFDISRGHGINQQKDGISIHNTLACYAHQRHTEQNPWVLRFLKFIEKVRAR
ncbi:MAG: cobyrinate a,c-diamide synthase [Pseudomonadota bacterium]